MERLLLIVLGQGPLEFRTSFYRFFYSSSQPLSSFYSTTVSTAVLVINEKTGGKGDGRPQKDTKPLGRPVEVSSRDEDEGDGKKQDRLYRNGECLLFKRVSKRINFK